jgi:hypothetical protein
MLNGIVIFFVNKCESVYENVGRIIHPFGPNEAPRSVADANFLSLITTRGYCDGYTSGG